MSTLRLQSECNGTIYTYIYGAVEACAKYIHEKVAVAWMLVDSRLSKQVQDTGQDMRACSWLTKEEVEEGVSWLNSHVDKVLLQMLLW